MNLKIFRNLSSKLHEIVSQLALYQLDKNSSDLVISYASGLSIVT